jgi:XapX domain-containing protein
MPPDMRVTGRLGVMTAPGLAVWLRVDGMKGLGKRKSQDRRCWSFRESDRPSPFSLRYSDDGAAPDGGMPRMGIDIAVLVAGVAVGVIYRCLGVRSPAQPVLALVGLFGMLMGQQVVPVGKRVLAEHPLPGSWIGTRASQRVFATLPGHHARAVQHPFISTEEQP